MSAPNSGPDPRKLPQAGRRLRSFMGLGLQGFRDLGFRDSGLPGLFFGCGGWGLGCAIQGLRFGIYAVKFRVAQGVSTRVLAGEDPSLC